MAGCPILGNYYVPRSDGNRSPESSGVPADIPSSQGNMEPQDAQNETQMMPCFPLIPEHIVVPGANPSDVIHPTSEQRDSVSLASTISYGFYPPVSTSVFHRGSVIPHTVPEIEGSQMVERTSFQDNFIYGQPPRHQNLIWKSNRTDTQNTNGLGLDVNANDLTATAHQYGNSWQPDGNSPAGYGGAVLHQPHRSNVENIPLYGSNMLDMTRDGGSFIKDYQDTGSEVTLPQEDPEGLRSIAIEALRTQNNLHDGNRPPSNSIPMIRDSLSHYPGARVTEARGAIASTPNSHDIADLSPLHTIDDAARAAALEATDLPDASSFWSTFQQRDWTGHCKMAYVSEHAPDSQLPMSRPLQTPAVQRAFNHDRTQMNMGPVVMPLDPCLQTHALDPCPSEDMPPTNRRQYRSSLVHAQPCSAPSPPAGSSTNLGHSGSVIGLQSSGKSGSTSKRQRPRKRPKVPPTRRRYDQTQREQVAFKRKHHLVCPYHREKKIKVSIASHVFVAGPYLLQVRLQFTVRPRSLPKLPRFSSSIYANE